MPLTDLLENNRRWSDDVRQTNPSFFSGLAQQQVPEYLWIGCADSRVPANEIVGLPPGEVFVHRNVANIVGQTDFNCLSVVEYAVLLLKVKHIIVCGHYGCGGVRAAFERQQIGLVDNWIHSITLIHDKHRPAIESVSAPSDQLDLLCELNVIEQARTLANTSLVRNAWAAGQDLTVNGWIYGLEDGLLHDLDTSIARFDAIDSTCNRAIKGRVRKRS
ncbi:MAG: carbonic anhydrase [Chthoniobacterales bacterium]